MDHGILAHLGGRLTRQQELLATEGLAYLLARSEACAGTVRRWALGAGCALPDELRFRVEVSGADRERPDIVGTDGADCEVLLIEGKFDAGLTENQPNAYLGRLGKRKPGMLLFVVPEVRLPRLWREVAGRTGVATDANGAPNMSLAGDRFLAMVSWRALLELMLQAAVSKDDPIASDVRQLQSLCHRFEGEAFLPFDAEELSSIRLPRRHRDLCDLADGIVNLLADRRVASLERLRATPQRNGYVRYLRLGNLQPDGEAMVALNYDAWRAWEASPLWLAPQIGAVIALRPHFERLAAEIDVQLFDDGKPMLPLPIEPGLERDEIVARCAAIVQTLAERIAVASPEVPGR